MTRTDRQVSAAILILIALAGATLLTGCQSYQPPGQELWRAL